MDVCFGGHKRNKSKHRYPLRVEFVLPIYFSIDEHLRLVSVHVWLFHYTTLR